ncbi:hypothetical protein GH714_008764 [Hevea brasiliensis]|uniref:TFIID subunit TAF5 NTD2 domain-containing protein n=1 Tax=Hevea brasiliensis TaxID=3981 RepID=A0A6A6MLG6_HEVBR|nr:hypothetical protein GH714_008764 [Hevea brasiliensis]
MQKFEELTYERSLSEDTPARYNDEYSKLRSWTHSSLDLYKPELLRVLYPVFVHCYMDLVAKGHMQEARTFFNSFREDHEMMHLRDLQKLEGVLSPSHLEEMEFAHTLRQSKVNIKICQYSNELLMQYLRNTKSTMMLGIVNDHINFQVSPGQPSLISDDAEVVTLIGSSQDAANQINKKEIHWGLLEDSLEERLENAGPLLSDSEKTEGEAKRVTWMKPSPTEVEQSIVEDLRNRVQLSSASLPSASFYTFINTHNGLNCSSISHDGSLVAGGFSDSSLKVWDMAKLGQQSGNSVLQGENDTAPSEHVLGPNGVKRSYSLFQGHSGPVYSATFSPLGDYVLSSSADTTIRLWSTKLNANLVCYKGHNYPVWDVQFSPVGHYFASASHDRTARIWSMDRIQPLRIMAGHLSDVDSGECVRIFIGHRSMILSLAMSPDGRHMASADEDGTIMMWDLSSGRCVLPLMGHNSCVWTLAFSCEGSLLASGSADCTVKLWDVTTSAKVTTTEESKSGSANRLRSLKTLPTKSTPVYTLRFSRRNLLFAAGVLSKSV